ncbi:MAG: carbohydrate-binding protein [Verrucomicrobiia bacterium]
MKEIQRPWRRLVLLVGLWAGLTPGAAFSQTNSVPSQPYEWQNVKVVAGGFIPGIIFNTKQPGLVYCRTDIGSSYKWDNQSKRWMPLTDWCSEPNLHGSESLATDPVDPNRLYLAQGMYSRDPAAIFRSMDQGKTFQVIDVPFHMGGNEMGRGVGERLAIDPNDNNILYFGSRYDGLWISKDTALTWNKVGSFPVAGTGSPGGRSAGLSFVVFDPATGTPGRPTGTIYAGSTERGAAQLYQSTNAGETWQPVPGQPTNFVPIHAAFNTQGMLYLVYDNGVGPYGVTDGAVWKFNPRDGAWTNITPVTDSNRPPGGYGGLGVDLQNPGTLVVASLNRKVKDDDDRIYRTTDGGATWKDITAGTRRDASASPYLSWGKPEPTVGWWIATLAIDPFDSNHVCYATGATIWNTDDIQNADRNRDTHWSVWAEGIEETAVIDLASPPAGANLISAFGDVGGFVHDDLNVSPKDGMFQQPLFTTTYSLDFAELNPRIFVRSGSAALHIPDRATLAYSLDGGHTWKPFAAPASGETDSGRRGDGGPQGGGVGTGAMILSADGSVFMSTIGTVQISTNHGETWTPVRGLPQGVRPVADRSNPARFYALNLAGGKIYRSTDGGATFTTNDASGLTAMEDWGMRLLAVPGREGDLWLYGRGQVYHSTDGGASFQAVANPPNISALGFGKAARPKGYPAIYIAGSGHGRPGLFRSDDAGVSWVRINDDQHQWGNRFRCIAGDPRIYGRLYVGTDGRGILYGDIAE